MSDTRKPLSPEILHRFGSTFFADGPDFEDWEEVLFLAECVALELLDIGLSPADIAGPLEDALQHWTPDVVQAFCNAGNINWEFDDRYELMLKAIIERIILTANGGGTLARVIDPGNLDGVKDISV